MRRSWGVRAWGGVIVLLLVVMGMLLAAPPARASAHGTTTGVASTGDSLSLALVNGTTFGYGDTVTPRFTVTLTLATKFTLNYFLTVKVTTDSGQSFGNGTTPTESPDGLTYTFTVNADGYAIPAGARTAVASFTNPATSAIVQSNPVSFTVTKATPSLMCLVSGTSSLAITPGQTLSVEMSYDNPSPIAPVDWQDGTYTVTFSGHTTTTYSNLVPDSNDTVTVKAPAQVGFYNITCAFSGTALFNPVSVADYNQSDFLISELHQLGAVQVFTSPTTLASNRPADVYVVFHAAAGLPTPSGYFGINLGNNYTQTIALGSDGATLVHLSSLPSLIGISQLSIVYEGDPYYAPATINFPLTNQPIPASAYGSGNSAPGNASATPTATAGTTPTVAPTSQLAGAGASATPTTPDTPVPVLSTTLLSSNPGLFWGLALLALLLFAGGIGGLVLELRRARSLVGDTNEPPAAVASPPWSAPHTVPYSDTDANR